MEEILSMEQKMDEIDEQIVRLLDQRLALSEAQEEVKRKNRILTPDTGRERELIAKVTELAGPETKYCAQSVFHAISAADRSRRNAVEAGDSLMDSIHQALSDTPDLFPPEAIVACQGTEGAYSQITCDRMFKTPSIMFFESFSHVFRAVGSFPLRTVPPVP